MKTFIRKKMGHTTKFRLIKPHHWPCNDPTTNARENILQFCEFQIGSRFKDWYKSTSWTTAGQAKDNPIKSQHSWKLYEEAVIESDITLPQVNSDYVHREEIGEIVSSILLKGF